LDNMSGGKRNEFIPTNASCTVILVESAIILNCCRS